MSVPSQFFLWICLFIIIHFLLVIHYNIYIQPEGLFVFCHFIRSRTRETGSAIPRVSQFRNPSGNRLPLPRFSKWKNSITKILPHDNFCFYSPLMSAKLQRECLMPVGYFLQKTANFFHFLSIFLFALFSPSFPLLSPRRHRFLQKTLIPSLRIKGGWSEEDGNSQEDGRIEWRIKNEVRRPEGKPIIELRICRQNQKKDQSKIPLVLSRYNQNQTKIKIQIKKKNQKTNPCKDSVINLW